MTFDRVIIILFNYDGDKPKNILQSEPCGFSFWTVCDWEQTFFSYTYKHIYSRYVNGLLLHTVECCAVPSKYIVASRSSNGCVLVY